MKKYIYFNCTCKLIIHSDIKQEPQPKNCDKPSTQTATAPEVIETNEVNKKYKQSKKQISMRRTDVPVAINFWPIRN